MVDYKKKRRQATIRSMQQLWQDNTEATLSWIRSELQGLADPTTSMAAVHAIVTGTLSKLSAAVIKNARTDGPTCLWTIWKEHLSPGNENYVRWSIHKDAEATLQDLEGIEELLQS